MRSVFLHVFTGVRCDAVVLVVCEIFVVVYGFVGVPNMFAVAVALGGFGRRWEVMGGSGRL